MVSKGSNDPKRSGLPAKGFCEDIHDHSSAHAWPPISRPVWRSSPLENSGVYLLSELPMPVLHMEFDWAVKKKNVRIAVWALMSIVTVILELEMAFNSDKLVYEKRNVCEGLKVFISFQTVMMLYYLYDVYEYTVTGAKKDWYHILYQGANPGPNPTFKHHMLPFIGEFVLIALHAPAYFDFRYWKQDSGKVKPFVSDKIGVFVLLRVYLILRVLRDYTTVYARRRLIYDSGHRLAGGAEIRALTALKYIYWKHTTAMIGFLAGGSILILAYMAHVAERDWQPQGFSMKNCVWYVTFTVAAMDYGSMSPKSEFGRTIAVLVVLWGMLLLSMFVSVVFECATLSTYEVWAIDWLKQSELMDEERTVAADVLASWWKYKKAIKKRQAEEHQYGGNSKHATASETYFKLSAIKKHKLLMEIKFKIKRAGGGNDGFPRSGTVSESAINLNEQSQLIRERLQAQCDQSRIRERLMALDTMQNQIMAKLDAM